nr:unnamed protein product [Digitaria exilis]
MEEQNARLEAEKVALEARMKSEEEIQKLKESLRKARLENEEFRKMAESKKSYHRGVDLPGISPMADARLLSIPPPIQPEDPDSPPPGSILLDPFGYLSDRTNATTADGRRSRSGKRILVTFWVATPPRVSCFTVHCPGLKANAFGDIPKVICAADDLVLLRIAIDRDDAKNIRYFVYQAGTKNKPPSLKLIRTPPYFKFFDTEVALLRRRDKDMFYLAVLRRAFIDWMYADKHFDLHLYNSKTGSWSTKLMHVDDSPQPFSYFSHNKVITIGGEFGSVGWVDLWRGILICDLLVDSHRLCFVPLPSPLVPKPLRGYPMYARNIIALDEAGKATAQQRASQYYNNNNAARRGPRVTNDEAMEDDDDFTFPTVVVTAARGAAQPPEGQLGHGHGDLPLQLPPPDLVAAASPPLWPFAASPKANAPSSSPRPPPVNNDEERMDMLWEAAATTTTKPPAPPRSAGSGAGQAEPPPPPQLNSKQRSTEARVRVRADDAAGVVARRRGRAILRRQPTWRCRGAAAGLALLLRLFRRLFAVDKAPASSSSRGHATIYVPLR